MTRKNKLVVGVWKDRLTVNESVALAQQLAMRGGRDRQDLTFGVAPAPLALVAVQPLLEQRGLAVVAQDVHWPAASGSYMGSTSLGMLQELSVRYCMIGHSERREFFGETDESIHQKIVGAINAGIVPILCVGDRTTDLVERKATLLTQILGALKGGTNGSIDISKIAIAYEPVWAISTWRGSMPLPSGADVQEMMKMLADLVSQVSGQSVASTPLLYGGSVAPKNADEYFSADGVDGALVGGASLTAESLDAVFAAAERAWT